MAINTTIGFLTEWRAIRSMEALRRLGRVETVVLRSGAPQKIEADRLVPGDIVMFEAGDIITADLRLIEVAKLQANESTLTGESMPVAKQTGAVAARNTVLMERSNLPVQGDRHHPRIRVGSGCRNGPGHRDSDGFPGWWLRRTAQETPLEKTSQRPGSAPGVGNADCRSTDCGGGNPGRTGNIAGHRSGDRTRGCRHSRRPADRGDHRAGARHVADGKAQCADRRLSAVETLGATGVILTDKTGTLTENRMTLSTIELIEGDVRVGGTGLDTHGDFEMAGSVPGGQVLGLVDDLLKAVVLCSNASLELESPGVAKVVGDPTETALLIAAAKRNIRRDTLQQAMPELREEPFESETKAMATFNRANGAVLVSVKGAPESVLPHCVAMRTTQGDVPMSDDQRETQLNKAHALGHRGLRTLAVATRVVQDANTDPYADLVFLGVVGLLDPPRPGVREAISCCRDAGIRVVMVTGDHVATAHTIAIDLGLVDPHPPDGAIKDARTLSGDLTNLRKQISTSYRSLRGPLPNRSSI